MLRNSFSKRCSASGLPSNHLKVAAAQRLSLIRSPDAPYLCEISGLVRTSQLMGEVGAAERDGEEEAQGRSLCIHLRWLRALLDLRKLETADRRRSWYRASGPEIWQTSQYAGYSRAASCRRSSGPSCPRSCGGEDR